MNDGVNIAAPLGTPIRAAHAGTVVYVGNEVRGFGNLILIRDGSGPSPPMRMPMPWRCDRARPCARAR